MNFKDKSQVKIEVIYRLLNAPKSSVSSSADLVRIHYNQNLDHLRVTNDKYGLDQKLNAYKIITENQTNQHFYNMIKDSGNECLNPLLKGFNVAMIGYGLTGRNKTHSLFESNRNSGSQTTSVLSAIYDETVKHISPLGVSVNFVEVSYNKDDQAETITDLLDFSGTKDSSLQTLDFQGFTNVVIRSVKELDNLTSIAQRRSQNWIENRPNEGDSSLRAVNNKSYIMARLNFVNIREKKQFSFYLVDLIGFNQNEQGSAEQSSLQQINKLLDDLVLMKDRIESYREAKLKAKKPINTKLGGKSAIASHQQAKLVGFLTNIILSSQTFFFVPLFKEGETYNEIKPILDRCSKLNQIRYSIEKEFVDTSRKIDIMSYQSFLKLAENVNQQEANKTLNLSYNNPSPLNAIQPSSPSFFSGQLSPIAQPYFSQKNEIYIDDNNAKKFIRSDSKSNEFNEEDLWENKVQTATFKKSPQSFGQEMSPERDEEEYEESPRSQTRGVSIRQTQQASPPQYSPRYSQDVDQSSAVNNYVYSPMKSMNKETYFIEYKSKAGEITHILEDFLAKEPYNVKKGKMPGEYYVLKKNFDMLYRLFREGEVIKDQFMNEFIELGKSLHDLKEDYDNRLEDVDYQCQSLEKKKSYLKSENEPKALLDSYEDDITRLIDRNRILGVENLNLMGEVVKFYYPESRAAITKEYEILAKKHNHLIKQYGNTIKQINDREAELNVLKRKDRLFVTEKKKVQNAQNRVNALAAELESKDALHRSMMEKVKALEKENRMLQEKVKDKDVEIGKVSKGYDKAAEEASLYHEMANAPTATFIKAVQEASDSPRRQKKVQELKELDHLINKLKSLNS